MIKIYEFKKNLTSNLINLCNNKDYELIIIDNLLGIEKELAIRKYYWNLEDEEVNLYNF